MVYHAVTQSSAVVVDAAPIRYFEALVLQRAEREYTGSSKSKLPFFKDDLKNDAVSKAIKKEFVNLHNILQQSSYPSFPPTFSKAENPQRRTFNFLSIFPHNPCYELR